MQVPFTSTTHDLKKNNIVRIIETLTLLGMATKAQLASRTGLSVATCGTVLNTLCERNQVAVHQIEASSGGRPAQCYAINPDYYKHLGLYVEGSDDAARIVWSVNSATGVRLAQGEYDFLPLTLDNFERQISLLLAEHPGIKAAGIGLPGVVAQGKVITCDISLFENIDIIDFLRKKYGLYIHADNDMNYTAWGFYRNSGSKTGAPVAYIYLPGVACAGCGIVVNDEILRGASNFAGEVAYLSDYPKQTLPPEEELALILTSIIAIINPARVAVSGLALNENLLSEAIAICTRRIPQRNMPDTVYRHSRREDYLLGITEQVTQAYLRHEIFNG